MPRRTLNCVDLFAGAGGFSLAAREAGMRVEAAVEFNPKACLTYRKNLVRRNGTRLYENDILLLDPSKLTDEHFSAGKACDIVLGGPPCQGFSVHRINGAGVDDPRNKLIHRYFDFVRELRPKVFLMENVPGILWDRHKAFLREFYRSGAQAGYDIQDPIVLDARDFGIPQRRKRVFILGIRSDFQLDLIWPPAPTHGDTKAIQNNPALRPWVPSASVFNRPTDPQDPNDVHMQHGPELVAVFRSTPSNGGSRGDSSRVLACHADHDGHKDVYGRINPREPGPTMTTACINPSKGRFVHPTKHHGITVRHAARFQTFPDTFIFEGGLMAAGEQIGNAVPIELGKVLLTHIKRSISATL
ncbi:DNA cytosine methyltransferase [Paraburkholderia sp. EG287B]|uniref:DNA cytosine methyltransferase n=1 Tax=Paraburkholderia sp. EG287B TaxID=3237010 RepID=UPI0034D1595B